MASPTERLAANVGALATVAAVLLRSATTREYDCTTHATLRGEASFDRESGPTERVQFKSKRRTEGLEWLSGDGVRNRMTFHRGDIDRKKNIVIQ